MNYLTPAQAAALPIHPECDRYPSMAPSDIAAMALDIDKNGQTDPIVLMDGVLIDGRHRIAACAKLGAPVWWVEHDGSASALEAWIASKNLHRRHLTSGQRAMFATALLPDLEAAAKKRQGDSKKGKGKSSKEAGEKFGVSARYVERAKVVSTRGTPELVDAVKAGKVVVTTAEAIALLPLDEQEEILRSVNFKLLSKHMKKLKAAMSARRKARKAEADAGRIEVAKATAPAIEGVEIRCCTNAELLDTLEDGSLAFAVADPNWDYDNKQNGNANKHYAGSGYEAIIADLDAIYDKCVDDCYLMVWVTCPHVVPWAVFADAAGRDFRWRFLTSGAIGKRESDDEGMGSGYHQRGDGELYLLYAKGKPRPFDSYHSNWYAATRERNHSEKPVRYLRACLRAWSPLGGLVGEFWAGLAPTARAATLEGRRCVSAECDPERHGLAVAALVDRLNEEPIEWLRDGDDYCTSVLGFDYTLQEGADGWALVVTLGARRVDTIRPKLFNIISVPQAKVWAVRAIVARGKKA